MKLLLTFVVDSLHKFKIQISEHFFITCLIIFKIKKIATLNIL